MFVLTVQLLACASIADNLVSVPAGYLRVPVEADSVKAVSICFEPFDDTIGGIFRTQLTGGDQAARADNVLRFDPSTQKYIRYWKTTGDTWSVEDVAGETTDTLPPGEAVWLMNHQASNQVVYLAGWLPLAATNTIRLYPAMNLVGCPFPAAQSMKSLNQADCPNADTMQLGPTKLVDTATGRTIWQVNDPASTNLGRWVDRSGNVVDENLSIGRGYWYCRAGTAPVAWLVDRPYENPFPENEEPPRILNIAPSEKGVTLEIGCRGSRNETLDVFIQDLTSTSVFNSTRGWISAGAAISTEGKKVVHWLDRGVSGTPLDQVHVRIYLVARTDIDANHNGIADANEIFLAAASTAAGSSNEVQGTLPGASTTSGAPMTNVEVTASQPPLDLENTDSDMDWFSDAEEMRRGTDPDSARSFPAFYFITEHTNVTVHEDVARHSVSMSDKDGSSLYVTNTNLKLYFKGFVASDVIISDSFDFRSAVTTKYDSVVPYTLPSTNNCFYTLYVRLQRKGGQQSPTMLGLFQLDTMAPKIMITNPPPGKVSTARIVCLQGRILENKEYYGPTINGEWPNISGREVGDTRPGQGISQAGAFQGLAYGTPPAAGAFPWRSVGIDCDDVCKAWDFEYTGFHLTGDVTDVHAWVADRAGHIGTQTVRIVFDPSGDKTAPHAWLDIPCDFTIQHGTTSWLSRTSCGGNTRRLDCPGWTDEAGVDVFAKVISSNGENSIHPFNVVGTNMPWNVIPLSEGTNDIRVTARDAAGNESVTNYYVFCDPNVVFAITSWVQEAMSPPPDHPDWKRSGWKVCGMASKQFAGGRIWVNGVETELSDAGDYLEFHTKDHVPLEWGEQFLRAYAVEADGMHSYFAP